MSTELLRAALKTPRLDAHSGPRKKLPRSVTEAMFTSPANLRTLQELTGGAASHHEITRMVDVVVSRYEPNDVGCLPDDIPERVDKLNQILLDLVLLEKTTDRSERAFYNKEILPAGRDFSRPLTEVPLADSVFSDHTEMHLSPGVRATLRMREPVLRPQSIGQAPRELDFSASDRVF